MTPSELIKKQLSGNILEDFHQKPKINKFLNLSDYSIYKESIVPNDEPLFEPLPPLLQFTDYEPLQLKEKIFKLRNKDKVARRVKILPPDSRLFQVVPAPSNITKSKKKQQEEKQDPTEFNQNYPGNKIAPGMEANFIIRFSPEAKIDYQYNLIVVTEREQFEVPIYAIGKRAMIDFPDQLDFGNCPVKYVTEKPVIIRNLGEKTTKWFLQMPVGFDADRKEGVLEQGNNEQIVIKFYPTEAKSYKSEVVLSYDKLEAYVPIMGIAHNSNVYLSKSYIQMDDVYISLQTQQTLQIINKSNVRVDFEWRAFSTDKEEQQKKNDLRKQLEEEEAEEKMLLKEIVNNEAIHEEYEIEDHDESDEDERNEKGLLLKRQKKAELMLQRKYKNIRKAIEDDLLLFQDDIFTVEPQRGQIWPNSEMTITITFIPKAALHYSCIAYCNISCSEERLTLNLSGEGIGPKAFLSQNELPVGNKFVNQMEKYEITIENRGEIECKFEMLPNERNFAKMFDFKVRKGTLGVGKRMAIPIEFCSTIPGEFKETFRWRLEGSTELLSLLCFGHVIAPTFKFDSDVIDFGKVSYSFPTEQKIKLTNESDVPFTFSLRIPGDGKLNMKEFEIEPQTDVIQKKQSTYIKVKFVPLSTKKYEMVMVVDIEGVGQDMFSLPIRAESEVPQVEIKPMDILDFGQIFIRDPDTRGITITNNSKLRAKFKVLDQSEETKVLAKFTVDQDQGIIEPGKEVTIKVTLVTNKIQPNLPIPMQIMIVGSNNGLPYTITLRADSIGPIVKINNEKKEIDFGEVQVLTTKSEKITIKNESKIAADFHVFTKNKISVFTPTQKQGELQPGQSMDITVVCCCDDAIKFQDILYFVIKEGFDIEVALKCKGTGSTIYCAESLDYLSFGTEYTYTQKTRVLFIENKGRQPQKLSWQKVKSQQERQNEKEKNEKIKKKPGEQQNQNQPNEQKPPEELEVYSIHPETIQLPPKYGISVQFRAMSTKKGKISEAFQLSTQVGQDRKANRIHEMVLEGEFIVPTVDFSQKQVYFKYSWEKNAGFSILSKTIELTCASSMAINFQIRHSAPFSISADSFKLRPGETEKLKIDFDPQQKTDKVSGQQHSKLQIIHANHPNRQYIDLVGELCFPNLELETDKINFGSILNDTSKKVVMKMKNTSEMQLYYEWTFTDEEAIPYQDSQVQDKNSSRNSIRDGKSGIPINEVFDILPLSGYLQPGDAENVEFVYNAYGGQRFKTTAVCHVDGGPNYDVVLIGDSSLITYKLSTDHIDLNPDIRFCEWMQRDFYIENTGKVTFEFQILFLKIQRKGYIECSPCYGKILGGEKQKVYVKICPVMPNDFKEEILVQIGYFEPQTITISGKGYYPSISTNLPRKPLEQFKTKFEEEFEKKKLERESAIKRQQLMQKARESQQESGSQQQQQQVVQSPPIKSIETIQTEIEKELDRQFFCQYIQDQLDEREREKMQQSLNTESALLLQAEEEAKGIVNNMNVTQTSKIKLGNETRLYEKINLVTFICDFENVNVNFSKDKKIVIKNTGSVPIDFSFDTQLCRKAGYTIQPERVSKMPVGGEQTITVTYVPKKNAKFGLIQTKVPFEIKNGAKYELELIANITIPEITLENVKDIVQFGKVLIGQRKTYFLRFVNDKEITCDWQLNTRSEMTMDKKKETPKFILNPTSGQILSKQKQIVEITFAPTQEKDYQQKFSIDILQNLQNPKPFHIVCAGTGTSINLEFEPQRGDIGPFLPYDQFAYTVLEVKNPSDYDTELYSIDFDQQYIEDESYLTNYSEFDTQEQLFLSVRNPGDKIWDVVKKSVDKKNLIVKLQNQLNAPPEENKLTEEEKSQIQKQLDDLNKIEQKIEYPKKVDPELAHNVIIYGQPGCGKSKIADFLSKEHKRAIINMADVVDWNIANDTEASKKVKKQLEELQAQKDVIQADREKLMKKAGKKAAELENKWGPINENQFFYIKEDILVECMEERLKHPECNAGIIVDGLSSKYYKSEQMGLKVLMRALKQQAIQFLLVNQQKDELGYEIWKMVEWDNMFTQASNLLEKDNLLQGAGSPKNQPGGKGSKKNKQSQTQLKAPEMKSRQQAEIIKEAQEKKKDPSKKSQASKLSRPGQSKHSKEVEEKKMEEIPSQAESPFLFELFEPKEWVSEEEKKKWESNLEILQKMIKNEFKDKLQVDDIYDPVFDEAKKEEKKGAKKGNKEVEVQEEPQKQPEVIDYTELLHKGKRFITNMPLHYNMSQFYKSVAAAVPAPVYPDPNTLPVPQPIFHQIVVKPTKANTARKVVDLNSVINQYYQILTPVPELRYISPPEVKESEKAKTEGQGEKQQPEGEERKDEVKEGEIKEIKDEEGEEGKEEEKKQEGGNEAKKEGEGESPQLQKNEKKDQDKEQVQSPQKKLAKEGKNSKSTEKLEKNLKRLTISQQKKKDKSGQQGQQQQDELPEKKQLPPKPKYQFKPEQLANNQARWVIPAKKTLLLIVKIFSKEVKTFNELLSFENFFGQKKYNIGIEGRCDFPTVSQHAKNLYWQVKKSRPPLPPESYLQKCFVQNENVFDFGPLLISKNPDKRNEPEIRKVNSYTFRITNSGKFDDNIQFALMSSIMENNPEYQKGVFWLETEQMQIPYDDVEHEIRVWAIPDKEQKFRDEIIVMIKDNPIPVIIPLQCIGSRPKLDIIEGKSVIFDRLLLKQSGKKEIRLKNNGRIPCKWELVQAKPLPEEFQLENTSGELKPTEEAVAIVNFKAIKQQKFSELLKLIVEDTEGYKVQPVENQEIKIEAEAFNISVECKFPENNQDNMLDFGAVRVGDIKDQNFTVKNIGLYKVQIQFTMKKKQFKDNFTIDPMKIMLEPNQEKSILVRFQSKTEFKLKTQRNTTDIIMEIQEGQSLELFQPIPINVSLNSVFSKYSILPLKNINFGPIQFNDKKTLSIEIKNEGLFEFNYTIFDYLNQEFRQQLKDQQKAERDAYIATILQTTEQAQSGGAKDKKGAKKESKQEKKASKQGGKKDKDADPAEMLRIGQWAINPSLGSIPPDQSQTIEITFNGNGQKLFEQKLAIDITGRDPEDQSDGILYEVIGESCIPGIDCENFENIFEEQVVMPSLNSSANVAQMIKSNVFYYEEKCFYFGTLVPAKNPDGICEKFKIINPNKIPCNVKFDVRKRNPTSNENFAFEIATKSKLIHPHEHIYVNVAFKPTIMAQYSGVFEATVENGESNPKTYKLLFDLRGEGAMPTLKLEKPKEWFNESTPMLKFPKTRVDKSVVLPIVIKNEGQIQATCKFDLNPNENFKFLDTNTQSLNPKTYANFNVQFKPKEPGVKQWSIQMQTLLNPYEQNKLLVTGEGYYEDIIFENLPKDLEDEVDLGDCVINQEKIIKFAIKNNSANSIRFVWTTQGNEDFVIIPRVGQLKGKSAKGVTLKFKSQKTNTYKQFQLSLESKQITQNLAEGEEFQDWDDSLTNVRYVTLSEYNWYQKKKEEEEQKRREEEAALANQSKKGSKKEAKKQAKKEENKDDNDKPPLPIPGEEANMALEEAIKEPEFKEVEKTEKTTPLKVNAVSDYVRYEANTREVYFKPTTMYSSRVHQFTVKNISLINLNYSCRIVRYEGEEQDKAIVDPGYFYISLKEGKIAPNCDEQFTVKYSPTEVHDSNERFLIITIDNLEPKAEPLVVELDGLTERPICHFELPPSTYREKKPDLDSSCNIIEFKSLGTKVKNVKKFYVVNPTASGYEFEWKKLDEDKLPPTANNANDNFFKCITQKGVCLSGKKFEMIFEYTPDTVGTHESYWAFEVPEQKIQQNFLIIGTVIEANVFFDVGKVNFGPLLIGGKNKESLKLKNLEDIPISFNFDKESVKGDPEYADSLSVFPLNGTIKANGEQPIEITFQPKVERSYNYNLSCQIKRKSRPINLNVKGIGYILSHGVYLENQLQVLLDPKATHILNFGDIYINEKRSKIIEIENKGEFNFDYSIKKTAQFSSFIQIIPEVATVKQNERSKIEVKFVPVAEYRFSSKSQFILSISSGPNYTFQLQGSAKKPGVDLSFLTHDFGPCYVLKSPLPVNINLEMRNRDSSAMSIDTLFEKKPYLDVQLNPGQVIMPLQIETYKDGKGLIQTKELNVLSIPIHFTPRECIKYNETITFDINGLHKIDVVIKGEGIPFKLELEKTEDQNVDLGIVRVGHEASRQVIVSNLSRRPIAITFDTEEQLKELEKLFLQVKPLKDFVINPKERKVIEIYFNPKQRIHNFKKELAYKIIDNQEQRKLLNIIGSCHGIELKLMEDTIGFGVVTKYSKKTKSLQLSNLGDIGAKFEWDTTFCKKYFTITPTKGFLPAHEDIFFQITFHPDVIDADIRFNKVRCNIEGSEPLLINLLGKCVEQPKDQISDIKFSTVVRTQTKQKVNIKNPTAEACKIKVTITPSITTAKENYFSGKEYIEIGPNGTAEYEVIYKPLTMTAHQDIPEIKDKQHEATLFFPMPDGTALLYNLIGQSTPPGPEQTIDVSFKANKQTICVLPVQNWLKQLQRFSVSWKIDTEDQSIFISGANTYDVPGDASKEYKLSIYGLKQTNNKLNVYFRNDKTHEYKQFRINLTITQADQMQKIELQAIVREQVSKLITIVNPLNKQVEIKKEQLISDNANINFSPQNFTIPPHSEFGFEIQYRPLLVKEETSKVALKNGDLGDFVYPLQLKGLPPATVQRTMVMKASLGSDIAQSFKFLNYCKVQTTYFCRVDKIGAPPVQIDPKAKNQPQSLVDFIPEQQQIQVPAADSVEGSEVGVSIRFEPSILGESQAQLNIVSQDGGEYNCILLGIGVAPQPKGPFKIGSAKGPAIEFKNPFFEAKEFILRIDNPSFTTTVKSPIKVDGKKLLQIPIAYKAVPDTTTNGRLQITIDKSDYPPWVFYIQTDQ